MLVKGSTLVQLKVLYQSRTRSLDSHYSFKFCINQGLGSLDSHYGLKFCINQGLTHSFYSFKFCIGQGLTPVTPSSSVGQGLTPVTASSSVSIKDSLLLQLQVLYQSRTCSLPLQLFQVLYQGLALYHYSFKFCINQGLAYYCYILKFCINQGLAYYCYIFKFCTNQGHAHSH